MSKELTFEAPFELPNDRNEALTFQLWLESVKGQVGIWGGDGAPVGMGFIWYTRRGISNNYLPIFVRRIKKCFFRSSVVSGFTELYNLEQRIVYIRAGEPHGTLSLREG